MGETIKLSKAERCELTQLSRKRSARSADVRRARLILLLDSEHTWASIRDKLDCPDSFIARWSKRFAAERLAGLFSRHAGQLPTTLTPALEARILDWTVKRKPPDGSTHWSTRKLAAKLKISHMMVARVWKKHALSPHRIERYMTTKDPDFEAKAAVRVRQVEPAVDFSELRAFGHRVFIEKGRGGDVEFSGYIDALQS